MSWYENKMGIYAEIINIKVEFGDEVDPLNLFKMAAELYTTFPILHDEDRVVQVFNESNSTIDYYFEIIY